MSFAHAGLAALAQRQVELADAGRWDELAAAIEELGVRAGELPAVAPADAREPLLRMAEAHRRLQAGLVAARSETLRELGALHRGRGAVRGYQGAALAPGGQVDGAA